MPRRIFCAAAASWGSAGSSGSPAFVDFHYTQPEGNREFIVHLFDSPGARPTS